MPRVTEKYLAEKREKIVSAALHVCQRKTISSVTMQDIINESGLSQGGIYRFYANIDEIFADMLERIRKEIDLKEQVEGLFLEEKDVEQLIEDVYSLLASFMKKHLMTYHKIGFEFNMLITNYPERAKKIMDSVEHDSIFDYLIKRVMQYVEEKIPSGLVKPILPMEDIITFISAAYDGIQMEAIVSKCYPEKIKDNYMCDYDIDKMFRALCEATKKMLGC